MVERINKLIERVTCQDFFKIIQRQIDTMIGDAPLGKVVRANALGAISRPHQQFAFTGNRARGGAGLLVVQFS